MGDIADEHYAQMMWEHGNPYLMEHYPFEDTPAFGGWRAYLMRHTDDSAQQRKANAEHLHSHGFRLDFSFRCRFCNQGITFIDHKPFDEEGPHRCLSHKTANV